MANLVLATAPTQLPPAHKAADLVGVLEDDAVAADLLQQYEARIAALERLVGKQALELEFLKGALKSGPRPKSATTSVFVGPRASASQKDAG
jgi:transposase